MKPLDIRARMLLAALLPMVLVSTLLAGFFIFARTDDLQQSYAQRTRSLVRQLALASEYGLFSGNEAQLQTLVAGALREPDVRWVSILDGRGQKLLSAGYESGVTHFVFNAQEQQIFDARRGLDWLAQPVWAISGRLDDVYEGRTGGQPAAPAQLGQVQVVFSRQSLTDRHRELLWLGGLIGLLGLIFGFGLALYLSGGVLRPIARVSRLIERIGRGDFSQARAEGALVRPGDPLQDLQDNLFRTAGRLAFARDDLENQVSLATQALRVKKEEAEQANQAKSRFLAAASHDLRQPMHALGMFVARLVQLAHDAPTRQLVGQVQASVQAMQMLLDGLLDISRLQAQAVPVQRRAIAVAELFEQLQRDMASAALEKNLTLHIRASKLWFTSDAALVYRILLNLTSNALRYTERGSVLVSARLAQAGQQVLLQVWDSGIGIAPEHQARVFDEFYQVANSARQRAQGLGLGLNIVQRSAQLLGHPLVMRSGLGCGSRFTLCLPVAPVDLQLPVPQSLVSAAVDDLRGVSVLVIEDDALVLAALAALLGGWGLCVHEASGLAQASAHLEAGCRPSLILSDYRLQEDPDGIAVIAHLRAWLGQTTPACLISGDTDVSLIERAQAAALTLLHKPVQPAKLRSLLRRLLLRQQPVQPIVGEAFP